MLARRFGASEGCSQLGRLSEDRETALVASSVRGYFLFLSSRHVASCALPVRCIAIHARHLVTSKSMLVPPQSLDPASNRSCVDVSVKSSAVF